MVKAEDLHELEQGDYKLPDTGRPVVRSTKGVISSGHYLTSMAGMRMLLNGGNAFDAMVAAGFAAAVSPDSEPPQAERITLNIASNKNTNTPFRILYLTV